MKKTIKKFLSTVLALSLLAGFSTNLASFATDDDIDWDVSALFGMDDLYCEEYVKDVKFIENFKGYIRGYMVNVDNSKVAEKLGLSGDDGEMWIIIDIIDGKTFIETIFTNVPIAFLPDTLCGKKLVIDEKIFEGFAWPQKDRLLCVPAEMVDTFKNIAKGPYDKRWVDFGVISHEDELFIQHLFDPDYTV